MLKDQPFDGAAEARKLLTAKDSVTYPSKASAAHLRRVIAWLLSALESAIGKTTERGPGQPPWTPSEFQLGEIEAFTVAGFSQAEIAEYFEVDEKTLRKHARRVLDHGNMRVLARVAQNVLRFALGSPARFNEDGKQTHAEILPHAWAMCFVMKTRGKRQGWTERVEVTGKDGGPIEFDYSSLTDDELECVDRARSILRRIAPAFADPEGDRATTH